MPCVRSPNVGRTTGRKTLIYRFDEGSKRCSSSGKCDRYRCSPPSTPPSTICSIWSAISSQERISRRTEQPPSPRGGIFAQPEKLAVFANARPVRVCLTHPPRIPLTSRPFALHGISHKNSVAFGTSSQQRPNSPNQFTAKTSKVSETDF